MTIVSFSSQGNAPPGARPSPRKRFESTPRTRKTTKNTTIAKSEQIQNPKNNKNHENS